MFIDNSDDVIKAMIKLERSALRSSAKVILNKTKEVLPNRNGFLKKSLFAQIKHVYVKGEGGTGQYMLNIGYLNRKMMIKKFGIKFMENPAWLETGTKPHIINRGIRITHVPTGKKALTNGYMFYGATVKHPGSKGNWYLRNTTFGAMSEIRNAQEKFLKELSEKIEQIKGMTEGDEDID